jgi:hypothetical protein
MKITLLKPHRHAGELYSPNTELEVAEPTARWLVDQGVARLAKKESTTKSQSTSTKDKGE